MQAITINSSIERSRPDLEFGSLNIGDPLIDREHEALFKKLLYLRRTSQSTEDLEGFYDALSMLGSDVISHFEHEEATFRFLGMPESEVQSHFQAHEEIVELNLSLMQG